MSEHTNILLTSDEQTQETQKHEYTGVWKIGAHNHVEGEFHNHIELRYFNGLKPKSIGSTD